MIEIGQWDALRPRYREAWGKDFWDLIGRAMRPSISVLDVGAGRRPTIDIADRPEGIRYVGLDVSRAELELAPLGAYDEIVPVDAQELVPELMNRFDVIVTWQVLEHFQALPRATATLRQYLRPGGQLVAHLSGRYAAYAILNRVLPNRLSNRVAARLMGREPETVFPAYYDKCHARGLKETFADWQCVKVIPFWRGADYFVSLGRLLDVYLAYEDWAVRRQKANLATHYTVAAWR